MPPDTHDRTGPVDPPALAASDYPTPDVSIHDLDRDRLADGYEHRPIFAVIEDADGGYGGWPIAFFTDKAAADEVVARCMALVNRTSYTTFYVEEFQLHEEQP